MTKRQRDEAGIFFDSAERMLNEAFDRIGNSFALDMARTWMTAGFWWANFHLRTLT